MQDWVGTAFRPSFNIQNQKEVAILDEAKALQPRPGNKKTPKDGHVRMTMRMQGELHSSFFLRDFPFDTQQLKIEVSFVLCGMSASSALLP